MTTRRSLQGIICDACGKPAVRTGQTQRYCPDCSGERDRERKRKHASAHPQVRTAEDRSRQMTALRARGADASTAHRASMTWPADELPEFRITARVVVPFDYQWSKNAIHSMSHQNRGHVWVRREANRMRDALTWKLRSSGPWYEGPVWLDVFVEKPDNRGDAINVLELVADGVKAGIDVDDRWYSIRRLDWSIVKADPRLYVGVSQAVTEPHRACSYCGAIRPLSTFGRNRSARGGHSRRCRSCSRQPQREEDP